MFPVLSQQMTRRVAAMTSGGGYASVVLADSPLAYWKLDESSGTTAVDSSGNGRDGTYAGGYTLSQSGIGGTNTAVLFDGSTAYVDFGNPAAFDIATGLTLEAWVKTSDSGYQYVLVKWGAAGGSDAYHLRIDFDGRAYFTTSLGGSYEGARDLNGVSALNDGDWHHLVATYDGAHERIYVDGVVESSLAASGSLAVVSSALRAGGLSDGTNTGNWLTGTLDDVAIYGTALSAARILAHYEAGTA